MVLALYSSRSSLGTKVNGNGIRIDLAFQISFAGFWIILSGQESFVAVDGNCTVSPWFGSLYFPTNGELNFASPANAGAIKPKLEKPNASFPIASRLDPAMDAFMGDQVNDVASGSKKKAPQYFIRRCLRRG